MKKKIASLLLSAVLLIGTAAPAVLAADSDTPVESCELCTPVNGDHAPNCPTRCDCGAGEGAHADTCPLYTCADCGVYVNQNQTHEMECVHYACPSCGNLVNQEGADNLVCYYYCLSNQVDDGKTNLSDYFIGFLDKSHTAIPLFSDAAYHHDENSVRSLAADAFPDYLIINAQFYSTEVELKYYEAESFDTAFNDDPLATYGYIEPQYFSSVVPATVTYATVSGSGTVELRRDHASAEDTFPVELSALAGKYKVADFYYEYGWAENWYFKLEAPETGWPEGAEEYLWIPAEYVTLSLTPGAAPEEPEEPTHSEGCADGCTEENCTCACHNALLQRFYTAANLEELDDMLRSATEEEWNTFPEAAWGWLDAFVETLPTVYKLYGVTEYDPPVESEVWYPSVNVTDAAGFGAPVTGQ